MRLLLAFVLCHKSPNFPRIKCSSYSLSDAIVSWWFYLKSPGRNLVDWVTQEVRKTILLDWEGIVELLIIRYPNPPATTPLSHPPLLTSSPFLNPVPPESTIKVVGISDSPHTQLSTRNETQSVADSIVNWNGNLLHSELCGRLRDSSEMEVSSEILGFSRVHLIRFLQQVGWTYSRHAMQRHGSKFTRIP